MATTHILDNTSKKTCWPEASEKKMACPIAIRSPFTLAVFYDAGNPVKKISLLQYAPLCFQLLASKADR
jgi:hypothetical protein